MPKIEILSDVNRLRTVDFRAPQTMGRLDIEIPSLLSHYILVEPAPTPGKLITFYSYKGGVGRSRALANVVLQLALRNNTVLCIDFDLEAPGLSDYFRGENFEWTEDEPESHIGLVDLFYSYRDSLFSRFHKPAIPWKELVQTICVNRRAAKIDFIGPGKQDKNYKQQVCDFDWRSFYDHWDGGFFIEQLRKEFVEKYDYVLVDSRTGITDISGICSVHLPDVLVAVFTPGPQSQKGLADALNCIEVNRKEMRPKDPLFILPLPCRIDHDVAREAFDNWFERLLDSYFAKKVFSLGWMWRPDEYFRRVSIEHFSRFVYEDTIESLVHHVDDEAGNAWKYRNLIKAIDSVGNIKLSASTLGLNKRLHEMVIMASQPISPQEGRWCSILA